MGFCRVRLPACSQFKCTAVTTDDTKKAGMQGQEREEEQKRSFGILTWHQMKMICQSFLFSFKLTSNWLTQSDADNYSVIRSEKQHGPEVKLSGFPWLTTNMRTTGINSQANFLKSCSYSIFSISILHDLHICPFCLCRQACIFILECESSFARVLTIYKILMFKNMYIEIYWDLLETSDYKTLQTLQLGRYT